MVESGEVIITIRNACDSKGVSAAGYLNEFILINKFVHPVAGKGEEIPRDNQPQKPFEFEPATACYMIAVNAKQQEPHADYKKNMADFMGN